MTTSPARPNILYLHSHDTGRYIEPYGHAVPAPNLQRLAERGVLFRQACCAAPTCSPSRASLLTGQCPHATGMLGLAHRGFRLNDYGHHIVHTLRKAGYHSTLIGLQHVAQDAADIGYDQIVGPQKMGSASNRAEDVAPVAVDFLSRDLRQPFFLSVGFGETHREYREPGPQEVPDYCLPPQPIPDTPQTRQDMAAFKASARVLDQGMGAVLDALDANGLAERTLVICTTDHGIAFPRMKCRLTEHGIGVMLIMRGPGGFGGGRVIDGLVSHIDLFPTLCEMLEIEPPDWLEGQSILPLIREEVDQVNEEIFAEVNYHAAYEPQRGVRTPRWKYIRRFEDRDSPVFVNCDDSLSKTLWLEYGWQQHRPPTEQLYDLIFDPTESHNLADDPSVGHVLAEMRDRLDRWMQATHDPLFQGPVPLPPGTETKDPNGLSPRESPIYATN